MVRKGCHREYTGGHPPASVDSKCFLKEASKSRPKEEYDLANVRRKVKKEGQRGQIFV